MAINLVEYLFDPTLDETTIDLDDYSNRLATKAILDGCGSPNATISQAASRSSMSSLAA
jgi:hypothetical protein